MAESRMLQPGRDRRERNGGTRGPKKRCTGDTVFRVFFLADLGQGAASAGTGRTVSSDAAGTTARRGHRTKMAGRHPLAGQRRRQGPFQPAAQPHRSASGAGFGSLSPLFPHTTHASLRFLRCRVRPDRIRSRLLQQPGRERAGKRSRPLSRPPAGGVRRPVDPGRSDSARGALPDRTGASGESGGEPCRLCRRHRHLRQALHRIPPANQRYAH